MNPPRLAAVLAIMLLLVSPCAGGKTPGYRLVTRADFDGLVCALLLKQIGVVEDVRFVHPNDLQSGRVRVTDRDILANVPYVAGCAMTFDHHASEKIRFKDGLPPNFILDLNAPSAARLVYEFHGGRSRFPNVSSEMMDAVDRSNRARFGIEEILRPKGWVLLSYLLDSRTGLERFGGLTLTSQMLVRELVDFCPGRTIAEIMAHPGVKERADLYAREQGPCIEQLRRIATDRGNVVIVDQRKEEAIRAGNRFLVYALFPMCDVSIHIMWGFQKQNTVLALGKSIVNRSCTADLAQLSLRYGGGGHTAAASFQVPNTDVPGVLEELVAKLSNSPSPKPASPSPSGGPRR